MRMTIKHFNLTNGDLRGQYLKLVKRYHPDTSGYESNEDFRQVKEEYDFLLNTNKKAFGSFLNQIRYPNVRKHPGIDYESDTFEVKAWRADGTTLVTIHRKLPTEIIDQIVNFAILRKKDIDWCVGTILNRIPNLNILLINYMVKVLGVNRQIIFKIIKRYR